MTCDLLIKTYAADHEWLHYCLRSIHRFARGFRQTIVVSPVGEHAPLLNGEIERHTHEQGHGYLVQQLVKLHADALTDADYILYMDSDTIFIRDITPEDVIVNGKVRWLYTPYASLGPDCPWKRIVEKAIGQPVEHEFMRRHPLCAPRWALEEFRRFFWRQHGMSVERYVFAQPGQEFSEWNILGAYLWTFHRDRVHFQNTEDDMGITYVKQHWSWSEHGLTQAEKNEMNILLA